MSRSAKARLQMHQPATPSGLVQLTDVLGLILEAEIRWYLTDIQAIAKPGSVVDIPALEGQVRSTPDGSRFTQVELWNLAEQLDQVIECEIWGFAEGETSTNADDACIVLRAFDSTEWTVEYDPAQVTIRGDFPFAWDQQ